MLYRQTHVEVMLALGNKACNNVWEANIIGSDKPFPNSDRSAMKANFFYFVLYK